jgi:hypothetical protein
MCSSLSSATISAAFLGAIPVGLFAKPSYSQMTELRRAVETSTPFTHAEGFPPWRNPAVFHLTSTVFDDQSQRM